MLSKYRDMRLGRAGKAVLGVVFLLGCSQSPSPGGDTGAGGDIGRGGDAGAKTAARGRSAGVEPLAPANWGPTVAADTVFGEAGLDLVAEFTEHQPAGIAVSQAGQIFVSFPRWDAIHPISVARLGKGGSLEPFPDRAWNDWEEGAMDPGEHFISVHALFVDAEGDLWALDAANPGLQGIVEGGAKLVRMDAESGRVERAYRFDGVAAPPGAFLNDVRVDRGRGYAYLSESGTGALVVLDLETGQARRVLENHPSTQAGRLEIILVEGRVLRDMTGKPLGGHVDGIALSRDGSLLYYHALTGRTLHRISTRALREALPGDSSLAPRVEEVASTVAGGSLLMDDEGNVYHAAVEENGIVVYNVETHRLRTVVQDPRLKWPDALAFGPDGNIYATVSMFHMMPRFNAGRNTREGPYAVYKVLLQPEAPMAFEPGRTP